MENRTFRFIKNTGKDPNAAAIVIVASEVSIQSFAARAVGRELSDIEINRVTRSSLNESTDFEENLEKILRPIIIDAALPNGYNNNTWWKEEDRYFLDSLTPNDRTNCIKEQEKIEHYRIIRLNNG